MPNYKVFNDIGRPIYSEITNGTDTLSLEDNAAVFIDFAHAKIHEGVSYSVSHLFLNIGNNSYADLRILTGSTKQVHILMDVAADGKSYLFLYRGTTYSNNGTAVTAYNLEDSSSNTSESLSYHSPTISNSGTMLYQFLLPAGKGSKTVGGEAAVRAERILRNSTDYLLRVQNVSASASDIAIEFNYYELSD